VWYSVYITRRDEMNKFEVNSREYEWSHGKKPRGFGSWAFQFVTIIDKKPNLSVPWWTPGGSSTFSDARKKAIERATELKAIMIIVCP
jgi:hypothetical protein